MFKALAIKELRETWWIGALAGGVVLLFALDQMGLTFDDRRPFVYWRQDVDRNWVHPVPFVSGDWPGLLLFVGAMAATVTALWQTLGESVQGTWPLLLHRPVSRRWLMLSKIGIGLAYLLLCMGAPVFVYALWAATPGTHANPFEWWMTGPIVLAWAYLSVAYLAAFLCGLRPARWWVSRLFPAVFAIFLWLPIMALPWQSGPLWPAIALVDVLLVAGILFVSRERDYA